jgi:VWFA-related protein
MKPHRAMAAAILFAVVAASTALSQQTEPQNAGSSTPTITKETSLVLVDTVVTDKKGGYIKDLRQSDFRVWEDNKEQPIKSFSFEQDAASSGRKQYMVMMFDNSTMNLSDQAKARDAALKFLDANTGANRYIAIVDFGGTLRVAQNFTTDAERLKKVVREIKFAAVTPTPSNASVEAAPLTAPTMGIPQLVDAEADFGVRTLLLALRNMAKSIATVPGRKTLVLFSAGFPMDPTDPNTMERESELTAAINACNKANVAVYPIDVRGLITPMGAAPALEIFPDAPGKLVTATLDSNATEDETRAPARLVYVQRGGGGTGGTGSGGGHGGGGTGGGGVGGHPGTTGTGGGTRTGTGGTRTGGGAGTPRMPSNPLPVAPYSQSRALLPTISDVSNNQQVLYQLAAGTGGFVIVNTNDLLGGLQKIANEQNEYYVLGYTPPPSDEGSCHVLKVKINRGGTVVRSRSGYCNVRSTDLLAGKPVEKQLEATANGSNMGTIVASMRAPYFYTASNTARVNLAIEIPSSAVKFEKQKGKEHAEINILGIAYKTDGTIAARFSDNVEFDFDGKDEVKEFYKKPYQYQNQFEIGAGHYDLKVAFTSAAESFGRLQIPLVVDSYDAQEFSMSAVALSKELRPLNQESASLDATLIEDRTPLVAQGVEIVPAGDARFKHNEPAIFYAEVYDPRLASADPPKFGVQMVVVDVKSREKKVDTGGPLPAPTAGAPLVSFGLKLPVDKLPAGSYELQVRAVDPNGGTTLVRTADFEVE